MFSLFKKSCPITEVFPEGFVDIHSHFLPGIDDGAKTIEESIELLLKMSSYGIQNFTTTPHVMAGVGKTAAMQFSTNATWFLKNLKKETFLLSNLKQLLNTCLTNSL